MGELINKFIDSLTKPIGTVLLIAIFLTSSFIFTFNFLPEEILIRMNLLDFLSNYNYIVFIALAGAFFLLIIQVTMMFYKNRENKKFDEYYKEQQDKLFNDPDAYAILKHMYEFHPEQVKLRVQNQKVMLLHQYGLITLAAQQTYIGMGEDIDNPSFPFILQPITEEILKNKYMK